MINNVTNYPAQIEEVEPCYESCWESTSQCLSYLATRIFVFVFDLLACLFCCKDEKPPVAPSSVPKITLTTSSVFQDFDEEPTFEAVSLPPGALPFVPKKLSSEEIQALLSVQYPLPPSSSSQPEKNLEPAPSPMLSSRRNTLTGEKRDEMMKELRLFTALNASEEELKTEAQGKTFQIIELPDEQQELINELFAKLIILKNYKPYQRLFRPEFYPRLGAIKLQINNIHPLRFIAHLLTRPHLAAALFELKKQYEANIEHDWWMDIKNKELVPSLRSYSRQKQLDQYLPGFVYFVNFYRDQWLKKSDDELKAMNLSRKDLGYLEEETWVLKLDEIQKMFTAKDWDGFFSLLGDKVVNKKL